MSYIYLQFLTLSSSLNILEAKHELVDRFTWNPIIPFEEVEQNENCQQHQQPVRPHGQTLFVVAGVEQRTWKPGGKKNECLV